MLVVGDSRTKNESFSYGERKDPIGRGKVRNERRLSTANVAFLQSLGFAVRNKDYGGRYPEYWR